MSAAPIVIIGAGGHAVSVAETARSAGMTLRCFVSSPIDAPTLGGIPVLDAIPEDHYAHGGAVVVAIGDNASRESMASQMMERYPDVSMPALIHASASVASDAIVDAGAVVLQGAIIGSCAHVGSGVIVNSGSVLEHESHVRAFASLAPRAVTGGRVTVGERSALGIGAVVRHGVSIGRDTVVGSASYVHDDLPSEVVAYGIPARVIRSRRPGDPYLG